MAVAVAVNPPFFFLPSLQIVLSGFFFLIKPDAPFFFPRGMLTFPSSCLLLKKPWWLPPWSFSGQNGIRFPSVNARLLLFLGKGLFLPVRRPSRGAAFLLMRPKAARFFFSFFFPRLKKFLWLKPSNFFLGLYAILFFLGTIFGKCTNVR